MRFSEAFIQKVIEASDLAQLISRHTQLRESHHNLMGLCPFPDHKEKTPSFSVSPHKQVYYCFGCGKKGNIISFLRDYHGMSFPEAIEYLAKEAGIPLEEAPSGMTQASDSSDSQKKSQWIRLYDEAQSFYQKQLERARLGQSDQSKFIQDYLVKRGLSDDLIREFHLGWAPDSKNSLAEHLKKNGFSLALAEEVQLVRKSEDGSYRDLFRHRLMFPITNAVGQVVAFGGRALGDYPPKYLNSPESPIFTKGKILYAYSTTAKFIRSEGFSILVEGYMDTLSLCQIGVKNVVAPMGTAFTPDQAKLLKRLAEKIIVLFDGDSAGINASEKALPICLAAGLHPHGLILPDQLDPDDFIKIYGEAAFKQLLGSAEDLFLLTVKRWVGNEVLSLGQKIVLCDQIGPLLNAVQDSRLRELYFDEVQNLLSVSHSWLKDALKIQETAQKASQFAKRLSSGNPPSSVPDSNIKAKGPSETASVQVIKMTGVSQAEAFVLASMIKNPGFWQLGHELGVPEWLSHESCKKLLQKAEEVARQNPSKIDMLASLLISFVQPADFLFYDDKVLSSQNPSPEAHHRIFMDAAKRIESDFISQKIKELKKRLHEETSSDLVSQLTTMQKRKVALKQKYQTLQESLSL